MTPTEEKALTADILEKVSAVHGSVLRAAAALTPMFHEFKGTTEAFISKIHESLDGDGNGKPGLKILVDRLSQAERRRQWWFRIATPIALGLVIADIYFKIKGG